MRYIHIYIGIVGIILGTVLDENSLNGNNEDRMWNQQDIYPLVI